MPLFGGAEDEIARQTLSEAGLDALPAHIVVLNRSGLIVLTNQSWRTFALQNGGDLSCLEPGADYLGICRGAAPRDAHAARALAGIEAVIAGQLPVFSMEYPCHAPREQRWFVMTVAPMALADGRGAIVSHLNVTASKEMEQALSASERRFRAMFENAAVGIAEVAPDGSWIRINDRMRQITGFSSAEFVDTNYLGITHPNDLDSERAQMEVLRAGAADRYSLEKLCRRRDGSFVWVNATVSCVRDANHGGIEYFVAIIEDISDRKLAEERQMALMYEVAHRGKNLLAVIQSIAGRSLTGQQSLAEARTAFTGRLQALSRTYSVLINEAFDGAAIDTPLHNELSPFGARATIDGPRVILNPKAAQSFALVIHELATNAAKYGALSGADGHVRAVWSLAGDFADRRLVFEWLEEGGPTVLPPGRRGFGTTLITVVAGSDFGCKPELTYDPAGFRYRFEAPLARIGMAPSDTPVRRGLQSPIVTALYDAWMTKRLSSQQMPVLGDFDWGRFAPTGALTIAIVQTDGSVRITQVGRALIEELGRPLREQELGDDETHGIAERYRMCAQKAEPTHELLRFDFGDGDPVVFERLLVPFTTAGGRGVTHVAGVVVFSGSTAEPGE